MRSCKFFSPDCCFAIDVVIIAVTESCVQISDKRDKSCSCSYGRKLLLVRIRPYDGPAPLIYMICTLPYQILCPRHVRCFLCSQLQTASCPCVTLCHIILYHVSYHMRYDHYYNYEYLSSRATELNKPVQRQSKKTLEKRINFHHACKHFSRFVYSKKLFWGTI